MFFFIDLLFWVHIQHTIPVITRADFLSDMNNIVI